MTRVLFVSDAPQAADSLVNHYAAALGVATGEWTLVYAAGRSTNGEAPSYEVFNAKRPLLLRAVETHKPRAVIALGHSARAALTIAAIRPVLFLRHPAWYARTGATPWDDIAKLKPRVQDLLNSPRVIPCARCKTDADFGPVHMGCRDCKRVDD